MVRIKDVLLLKQLRMFTSRNRNGKSFWNENSGAELRECEAQGFNEGILAVVIYDDYVQAALVAGWSYPNPLRRQNLELPRS